MDENCLIRIQIPAFAGMMIIRMFLVGAGAAGARPKVPSQKKRHSGEGRNLFVFLYNNGRGKDHN